MFCSADGCRLGRRVCPLIPTDWTCAGVVDGGNEATHALGTSLLELGIAQKSDLHVFINFNID